MNLRKETPCDFTFCPYDTTYLNDCEYWCEKEEEDYWDYRMEQIEKDNLQEWQIYEEIHRECEELNGYDYEVGFDSCLGCFTDDC